MRSVRSRYGPGADAFLVSVVLFSIYVVEFTKKEIRRNQDCCLALRQGGIVIGRVCGEVVLQEKKATIAGSMG